MSDCPDKFMPGSVMAKLSWLLTKIENTLVVVALGVMVSVTFTQVVMRFGFNSPFMWGDELGRYLSAYVTYIGIAYSARRDSHIKVTFFSDKLPAKMKKAHAILVNFICMALCLYLFLHSFELLKIQHPIRSTAMNIPMSFVYLPMVIGVLFAGIRYLTRNIVLIRFYSVGGET